MHFQICCYKNLEHPSFFPPVSAILSQTQPHKDPHCRLSVFEPTCVTEINELIMKSPSKSRELDPVPTSLIKQTALLRVNNDILSAMDNGKNHCLSFVRLKRRF